MFERFTDRSRRAVVLAQEEARLLNHDYIGTEHLLLGLLADPEGGAARTLASLNITLDAARDQVREIIGEGGATRPGHIPFTPRAKKVLELSLREALSLRSQSIGTEHLLLGLVAEGRGVGAQVLERLGAPLAAVRQRAIEHAGTESDPAAAETSWVPRGSQIRIEGLGPLRQALASIDRRLAAIERHLGIATDPGESVPSPEDAAPEPPAEGSASAAE